MDEVPRLVVDADLALLPLEPSDRNKVQGGAFTKLADAFAGGRPVLASDLSAVREAVPDDAGIFFPPGDATALSAQLVRLAKDAGLRTRLGNSARASAEERHDAVKIRAQLLWLYSELTKLGSRGDVNTQSGEAANNPTLSVTQAKRVDGRRKKRGSGESKTDPAMKARPQEPSPETEPPPGMEGPVRAGGGGGGGAGRDAAL
jgi:hypothetical protein